MTMKMRVEVRVIQKFLKQLHFLVSVIIFVVNKANSECVISFQSPYEKENCLLGIESFR